MRNQQLIFLLKSVAIAGNGVFILWILYNGFSEGFKGSLSEITPFFILAGIFIVNTILLLHASSKKEATAIPDMQAVKRGLSILFWIAITSNILFMLLMTYKRISESFKGSIYQQLSYIGLMVLLLVTVFLLFHARRRQRIIN